MDESCSVRPVEDVLVGDELDEHDRRERGRLIENVSRPSEHELVHDQDNDYGDRGRRIEDAEENE